MPQLTVAQYNLVYNMLSFTFAGMAAATLFFWLMRPRATPTYKTAVVLSGLVTAIASYHYLRIFQSWDATFSLANGAVTLTGKPFNDAYRYVDWLLTVPLLLVELILVMRLSRSETIRKGILLPVLAVLMIALGYPGEIATTDSVRWTFWVLSMIPFVIIVYQLVAGLSDAVSRQPAEARGLVSGARWLTVVAWLFYPIVFLFPMLGFSGGASETFLQVGYSIADLVAKAVFGLLIVTIAIRKSDAERAQATA